MSKPALAVIAMICLTSPALAQSMPTGSATVHAHQHGAGQLPSHGSAAVGQLEITGGFARATLPGQPVGGGYLMIANNGDAADRLVSARSNVAGRVEIREMAIERGLMKMRELPDGLEIAAAELVELAPGGFHLMFMELKEPLVEGAQVEVTLTFAVAGDVSVPLAIAAPNAGDAGHPEHN